MFGRKVTLAPPYLDRVIIIVAFFVSFTWIYSKAKVEV